MDSRKYAGFYYGFYEALTLAGLEDEYLDWRIARTAGKAPQHSKEETKND